jgi:hypothetical protein
VHMMWKSWKASDLANFLGMDSSLDLGFHVRRLLETSDQ